MGLETATYIDDLVSTNPVGASDNVSTADDHIRLIKSVLLATFPNIDGAVTATQAELNSPATLSSLGFQFKYKTADQIKTNNTLTDDAHITGLTLETGEYYSIEGFFKCQSDTLPDIKFNWEFTDAPQVYSVAYGASGASPGNTSSNDHTTPLTIGCTSAAAPFELRLGGMFQANAADGGTLKFQWAQNSTSGGVDTTIYKGSWVRLTKTS